MRNLIPLFIQQRLQDEQRHGTLEAYTMFVDLSGFTPLTYALMQRGTRGAEELSGILNEIFAPLVKLVYTRGGFIPYYAGDSFTAIFPKNDQGIEAEGFLSTAAEIRQLFSRRSFQFGEFVIGLKIGLSCGEVAWGITGNENFAFYFRGDPIEKAAYAQSLASNQEIVFDGELRKALGQEASEFSPAGKGYFHFEGEPTASLSFSPPEEKEALSEEIVRRFLPSSLLNLQAEGEFRTVSSLFISFEGMDSHEELDRFASLVLEKVIDFKGYFKEIEFGDKGGVIVAFFGAPVSFENNLDRALECAYTLQNEVGGLGKSVKFRGGLTTGTVFTGIVGGEERCQYACVGNRVNLAARLMTSAGWGDILVDEEIQKSRFFRFQAKGNIKYKGIKGPVPTFLLKGRSTKMDSAHSGQMVGRNQELDKLANRAWNMDKTGTSAGVAFIYGEAGIGKSRLTYELQKRLTSEGAFDWHICQSDQILRKPFNPFVYWMRNYFDQSLEGYSPGNLNSFESRFEDLLGALRQASNPQKQEVERELERTKSVLAALIGLYYPESLWEQLDARGRYQNSIQAVVNLFLAEALRQPYVLDLEDAHWLDESSEELLRTLLRNIAGYPIFVVITSRYHDDGTKPAIVPRQYLDEQNIPWEEYDLNFLNPESVRKLAETTLGGTISEEFYDLLMRSSNSNPFYLQQLLEYFTESKILVQENGQWTIKDRNIKLSSSISAILTARIDRLSTPVKETVKTAAVIGREFEVPVLTEVIKAGETFGEPFDRIDNLLEEKIQEAQQGRIWLAMNDMRYIFRHSLLREAAYNMQMRARLRHIHLLIAEAIERLYANKLEERFVDLAFHFDRAGVEPKTCLYLEKSAEFARNNFQNKQALEFFDRLLIKLERRDEPERQIKALLEKGHVLELIGEWEDSEAAYRNAIKLANRLMDNRLLGKAHNDLGRLLLLKGDYNTARSVLQVASQRFQSIDDQAGVAEVAGNLGNLYFRQGQYEEARAYFLDSIGQNPEEDSRTGTDPQIIANLGLTYMNEGDYESSILYQKEQLDNCRKINDKQGMAILSTYLGIVYLEKGDFAEALESFEMGLEICEELGNKQLTAIATGNMGLIHERRGEYEKAMAHYEHDLALCEELGDKQGTAIALGLIGHLLNIKGEFHRAIEYLQKDLMLCEELGYQKGIAKAVNTLGDVFYFTRQYERSLHFYNRAIDVTRNIGNKLVLGFSLVEKGAVLLELKDKEALKNVGDEALELARQLGNPDLLFEAELLHARILQHEGKGGEAKKVLKRLAEQQTALDQQAAALFELARMSNGKGTYREEAMRLYRDLYHETPRYVFKQRAELLENSFAGDS